MADGIFGNLFDFNNDGKLDPMEQAAELGFLQMIIETSEKPQDEETDN